MQEKISPALSLGPTVADCRVPLPGAQKTYSSAHTHTHTHLNNIPAAACERGQDADTRLQSQEVSDEVLGP